MWGDKAAPIYDELHKFGSNLFSRPTADNILDNIDGRMLWKSALTLNVDEGRRRQLQQIYDPRFMLRLFISLLEPGREVS
jgi:hypothetical protein